jgi:hypothetical protein
MIKQAIDRILELGKPEIKELFGTTYSNKKWSPIDQPRKTSQEYLKTRTLTSLCDWLLSGSDDALEACDFGFIHISDHNEVRIISSPEMEYRTRHRYVVANAYENNFLFGEFMTVEQFIISASCNFIMDENMAALIKHVSSIRSSEVLTVEDDGISQSVTATAEFNRIKSVAISPFQELKPYRTFREIGQPPSKFLLRMKQQKDSLPRVALFNADNGMWKLEAMKSIASFLREKIGDENLKIIL